VPYAYAVLTRDPYHIESVQAVADYWDLSYGLPTDGTAWGKLNQDGSNWINVEVRGQAWKIRDLAQAILVTPAVAPSYLIPQAEFKFCLDQHHIAYQYRYANPWTPFINFAPFFNSLCGNAYLRANGGLAMYQEDYMLWALNRVLVADPTWIDMATKWLTPRIEMGTGTHGWCHSAVTMYGNPGYWAQGPISGGQAMGALFSNWGDAWSNPVTGWVHFIPQTPPSPNLNPCPGNLQVAGNTWGYHGNLFAAICGLKQLGVCNNIPGFTALYSYFTSGMRAKWLGYQAQQPAWRQCTLAP
jgi:hypothetical protein